MKGSLQILRSRLPWLLGLLILATAFFLRLRALGEEIDRIRISPPGADPSQALLDDLDQVRENLPPRGRISLLQQGESQARELRPLIEAWSAWLLAYYRNGQLPADPASAAVVEQQAALLRPQFPELAQGKVPTQSEIAGLLEKVHFATLDAANHTLAQYALAPLIIDPVMRNGLVLARLPKGKARSEALRLGLRWKKAVGNGWYLLEKRP